MEVVCYKPSTENVEDSEDEGLGFGGFLTPGGSFNFGSFEGHEIKKNYGICKFLKTDPLSLISMAQTSPCQSFDPLAAIEAKAALLTTSNTLNTDSKESPKAKTPQV